MSTPSVSEDELTKWILEQSVSRVLVRMRMSGSESTKPGDETVYAELVVFGRNSKTMLHLVWSLDAPGGWTSMNLTFESNPKKVGSLASKIAHEWAVNRKWGEKRDDCYNLSIYRTGAARVERSLPYAIVRQHLARLHGAILEKMRTTEALEGEVLAMMARRLQVVITEGNMNEMVR